VVRPSKQFSASMGDDAANTTVASADEFVWIDSYNRLVELQVKIFFFGGAKFFCRYENFLRVIIFLAGRNSLGRRVTMSMNMLPKVKMSKEY
jgi:hypothetical protein